MNAIASWIHDLSVGQSLNIRQGKHPKVCKPDNLFFNDHCDTAPVLLQDFG